MTRTVRDKRQSRRPAKNGRGIKYKDRRKALEMSKHIKKSDANKAYNRNKGREEEW